jgi:hypothetical protein
VNEEKNDERIYKLRVQATDEQGEVTQHVIDLKNVREVFGDAA